MRKLVLLLAVLCVSCDGVSVTPFALTPCHVGGLSEEVRCGVLDVPEDRLNAGGRTVSIQFAVLPALRRLVEKDPLVLFAGGPGQGGRGLAQAAARYFKQVRRHRDIVLIDFRGTGGSHRLACPALKDEIAALGDVDAAGQARQCAAALDGDPRFYTHQDSLADVDAVRQALGYQRINIWGGSWGTRAALLYALRYPAATRTLILDGPVSLSLGFPRTASRDAGRALDLLIAGCSRDADCRSAFPDPAGEIAALDRQFDAGAIEVKVRHPRTGQPVRVSLDRGMVFDIIRGALYVPGDAAALLAVIRAANQRDFAPLVAQHVRTSSWSIDDMAMGATSAVLCSEDLPRIAQVDLRAEAGRSRFGSTYGDYWRQRCQVWPRGPGWSEDESAVSHVPALVLTGNHDPVTPPSAGEAMARHFARARHLVVPAAGHNTSFSSCVSGLIAGFIVEADASSLDAACVDRLQWPPFAIGAAGSRP